MTDTELFKKVSVRVRMMGTDDPKTTFFESLDGPASLYTLCMVWISARAMFGKSDEQIYDLLRSAPWDCRQNKFVVSREQARLWVLYSQGVAGRKLMEQEPDQRELLVNFRDLLRDLWEYVKRWSNS